MSLSDIINIDECTFVAAGSLREVYTHPTDDSVLIKVVRADMVGPDGHPSQISRKGKRPWGVYLAFRREIDEYLIAARRQIATPRLKLPFARPIGLVPTTRGLGLLVERISDNGATVPTLQMLHKSGQLTPQHVAALRRFFSYCIRYHIVLGDVHLGNLVVDPTAPDKLICIDGFGEKTLIPVHRYSPWLNQRKLERKLARILKHAGLE
ncbi:PhoP regulatory network protein YrbL [Monaibacterium marinum]|uniref:PhoP regulatory network protein YrbL n=1 Tax=Pontivivens marinum TaxID=1690039 RepID=A0A2C9CVU3_9RHOB|nr:YrbL family protein [Monaibacterium marinum]SOH95378.1 PhoP regulatory network protein YrbL [Monaibacterium marinum]